MSMLFSTEEAFVGKRRHRSIAQSLRRWGKWLGGQPVSGEERGQSKEIYGHQHPPRKVNSGSQSLTLGFFTGENGLGVSVVDSPPTLIQYSFSLQPWQERERCNLHCAESATNWKT